MTKLEPRNTQTRVKHEILSSYLDAWGGIILWGTVGYLRTNLSTKQTPNLHFIYVDCFSYAGKYLGEKEDSYQDNNSTPVYGSPVIGIQSLDRLAAHAKQKAGMNIKINSILIEGDKKTYDTLKQTLNEVGYKDRVVETQNFKQLANGQIAIVNADSTSLIDELLSYTVGKWAFYLIDPYGPSGIPYTFVSKVVRQEHHDVMINFIYEDLSRKAGMSLNNNLPARHQQLVDYWTKAFGNDLWKKIAREAVETEEQEQNLRNAFGEDTWGLSSDEIREKKEEKFVSMYHDVLHTMDPTLAIKFVKLRFGDKERTMFYLYLTTHDPTGALSLNKILWEGEYSEHVLRHRLKFAQKTAPPAGQLFLMPPTKNPEIPKHIRKERPSRDLVAQEIFKQFAGRTVTKKDVYTELANTDFFTNEVDGALGYLQKQKLAVFIGKLTHKTEIIFSKK